MTKLDEVVSVSSMRIELLKYLNVVSCHVYACFSILYADRIIEIAPWNCLSAASVFQYPLCGSNYWNIGRVTINYTIRCFSILDADRIIEIHECIGVFERIDVSVSSMRIELLKFWYCLDWHSPSRVSVSSMRIELLKSQTANRRSVAQHVSVSSMRIELLKYPVATSHAA